MTYYDEIKSGHLLAGRYRITRELGRGHFGVVFHAMHEIFARPDAGGLKFRPVAVKLFTSERVTSANLHEVFHEAMMLEALAALARADGEAPHIVQVFDADIDELGRPFLVMEYVEGGSLEKELRLQVGLARAVELLRLICAGVKLAHAHGICHRDLKPANVLFTSAGFLKVSDFGVAVDRASWASGGGTVSYSPPESEVLGPPKAAYDVYALGLILLEFLLRRNPLDAVVPRGAPTPGRGVVVPAEAYACLAELRDPVTRAPMADSLAELRRDTGIRDILARCLALSAGDRYPSAAELDAALDRWQQGTAPSPRPLPRPSAVDLLRAGQEHAARREWTKAQECLREALRLDEHNADVHLSLAGVYAEMRRWPDAIRHQKQAVNRFPATPTALDRLAEFYELDCKPLEARVYRQRARQARGRPA